jgi:hypothetical protein
MASGVFNPAKVRFARGEIDWEDHDIRVLLVDDVYTFDATDEFVADVVASELVATDYARQTLSGLTVTQDDGANLARLKATAPTFVGLGGAANDTIGGAVVYRFITNDAASPVIAFIDTSDFVTQDGDVILGFPTDGVLAW